MRDLIIFFLSPLRGGQHRVKGFELLLVLLFQDLPNLTDWTNIAVYRNS